MIRRLGKPAIGMVLLLLLAGCWDIKPIQDTNYMTAIGYDYEDGSYIVYGQLLDFANVSKQEGGKASQPAPVWSGREEGSTVIEAMTRLVKSSQQPMFWGHVSSIVFSERALRRGIDTYLDGLIRYRELRYTQWVYGTKEPIDRLFAVKPFFNLSPLASILHQPEDNYRQRSYIRPIRLHRAVAHLREPGYTMLLPSLGIDAGVWKRDGSNDPKLVIGGVFAIARSKPAVWIPESELTGLRWLEEGTRRSSVIVSRNGAEAGTVTIERPRVEVSVLPSGGNGKPEFAVRIRGKGNVSELLTEMDVSEIEKEASRTIVSEIERTYAYGRKNGIDLYHLGHELYRRKFPLWSKLTRYGESPLTDAVLKSIQADIRVAHTGMYKLDTVKSDY
ncbi:Ger(x)C family spore germination protein [Paenibacillus flagellatus]|uniref:Ger(X)C family spore germination protein n=1 Tax=Paenibacillus flagellatus TaxID=2211139 RepID=A0A2V5JXG9_9BACL|nr:Ger(x)C family spore germination protein [Paenibacillus flagellatus]PYI51381.1 Ger(x)C family spore germination protein [Paenibacillus flagellatus]